MRSCHAVPLLVTVCESADSTAPTRERARSAWILRSDAAGPLNFGRHRTSAVALGVSAGDPSALGWSPSTLLLSMRWDTLDRCPGDVSTDRRGSTLPNARVRSARSRRQPRFRRDRAKTTDRIAAEAMVSCPAELKTDAIVARRRRTLRPEPATAASRMEMRGRVRSGSRALSWVHRVPSRARGDENVPHIIGRNRLEGTNCAENRKHECLSRYGRLERPR